MKTKAHNKNIFARSPTLDTVIMIEKTIKKYSGEHRRIIWNRLPKKVMWQTYLFALEYLQNTYKIAFDRKKHVAYIWNPQLYDKYSKRKDLKWKQ